MSVRKDVSNGASDQSDAQTNLDNLVAMAHNADLFVVISFRTGPGRSDFTFYRDGDWYPPSYLIETVWTSCTSKAASIRSETKVSLTMN